MWLCDVRVVFGCVMCVLCDVRVVCWAMCCVTNALCMCDVRMRARMLSSLHKGIHNAFLKNSAGLKVACLYHKTTN